MAFKVSYSAKHRVALLKHDGPVDVGEITASRGALAACATENDAVGVVIDILEAEITAAPADIIPNVAALCEDLRADVRLGFVARKEHQGVVAMIVSTVAFNSGAPVAEFHDHGEAMNWAGRPD